MIVVNGENHVLGRLCSLIAKKLMKGEKIYVVNAEKIIVVGKKSAVMEKFVRRQGLTIKGSQTRNPKFPKMPDRLVKYALRGMVPYPERRGREALKNFRAFIGVPKELEGKELQKFEGAMHRAEQSFMTMGEISTKLGAKWEV